jgi:hypothetical protein
MQPKRDSFQTLAIVIAWTVFAAAVLLYAYGVVSGLR